MDMNFLETSRRSPRHRQVKKEMASSLLQSMTSQPMVEIQMV
jgi:hypothetical protein